MQEAIAKAGALIEAMGYIRGFRDRIVVLKLGGSVLDDPAAQRNLLTDVAFMATVGMRPIIVHGGGQGHQPRHERGGSGTSLGTGPSLYRPADADHRRAHAGA